MSSPYSLPLLMPRPRRATDLNLPVDNNPMDVPLLQPRVAQPVQPPVSAMEEGFVLPPRAAVMGSLPEGARTLLNTTLEPPQMQNLPYTSNEPPQMQLLSSGSSAEPLLQPRVKNPSLLPSADSMNLSNLQPLDPSLDRIPTASANTPNWTRENSGMLMRPNAPLPLSTEQIDQMPLPQNELSMVRPQSDPTQKTLRQRAMMEMGPQQKRGFWGVLKDIGLGFAGGGIGGALYGGLAGGDARYNNRLNQRMGDIAALEQQQREQADQQWDRNYKLQSLDNALKIAGIRETGDILRANNVAQRNNQQTTQRTNQQKQPKPMTYEEAKRIYISQNPDFATRINRQYTDRASELRNIFKAQGIPENEIDLAVRDRLVQEKADPKYDVETDPEAQAEIQRIMSSGSQQSVSPAQQQATAQPVSQTPQKQSTMRWDQRPEQERQTLLQQYEQLKQNPKIGSDIARKSFNQTYGYDPEQYKTVQQLPGAPTTTPASNVPLTTSQTGQPPPLPRSTSRVPTNIQRKPVSQPVQPARIGFGDLRVAESAQVPTQQAPVLMPRPAAPVTSAPATPADPDIQDKANLEFTRAMQDARYRYNQRKGPDPATIEDQIRGKIESKYGVGVDETSGAEVMAGRVGRGLSSAASALWQHITDPERRRRLQSISVPQ